MSRYLLDTNIVSHFVRDPFSPIGERIRALSPGEGCISAIVAAELRFGAEKSGSKVLARRIDELTETIQTEPFETPADQIYADIRCALEAAGTPIGAFDMLIAAHALALDAVLVTDNTREFERVPGLRLENWLRG